MGAELSAEKLRAAKQSGALSLSDQQLTDIPLEIRKVRKWVKALDLSNNLLPAFPRAVKRLVELEKLNLSFNKLAALGLELKRLTKLKTLDLAHNEITTLSDSCFATTPGLTSLDLSSNKLNAIAFPLSFESLHALTYVNVSDNPLRSLPHELLCVGTLRTLLADNCAVSSIPAPTEQSCRLTTLSLCDNLLQAVPTSLAGYAALETLKLSGNSIGRVAVLPASLVELDLSRNQLTSVAGVLHCSKLRTLRLSDNRIEALDAGLAQLVHLETLELHMNSLTALPAELSALTALRHLNIVDNQISEIPPSFVALTALEHVDLAGNPLPTELRFADAAELLQRLRRAADDAEHSDGDDDDSSESGSRARKLAIKIRPRSQRRRRDANLSVYSLRLDLAGAEASPSLGSARVDYSSNASSSALPTEGSQTERAPRGSADGSPLRVPKRLSFDAAAQSAARAPLAQRSPASAPDDAQFNVRFAGAAAALSSGRFDECVEALKALVRDAAARRPLAHAQLSAMSALLLVALCAKKRRLLETNITAHLPEICFLSVVMALQELPEAVGVIAVVSALERNYKAGNLRWSLTLAERAERIVAQPSPKYDKVEQVRQTVEAALVAQGAAYDGDACFPMFACPSCRAIGNIDGNRCRACGERCRVCFKTLSAIEGSFVECAMCGVTFAEGVLSKARCAFCHASQLASKSLGGRAMPDASGRSDAASMDDTLNDVDQNFSGATSPSSSRSPKRFSFSTGAAADEAVVAASHAAAAAESAGAPPAAPRPGAAADLEHALDGARAEEAAPAAEPGRAARSASGGDDGGDFDPFRAPTSSGGAADAAEFDPFASSSSVPAVLAAVNAVAPTLHAGDSTPSSAHAVAADAAEFDPFAGAAAESAATVAAEVAAAVAGAGDAVATDAASANSDSAAATAVESDRGAATAAAGGAGGEHTTLVSVGDDAVPPVSASVLPEEDSAETPVALSAAAEHAEEAPAAVEAPAEQADEALAEQAAAAAAHLAAEVPAEHAVGALAEQAVAAAADHADEALAVHAVGAPAEHAKEVPAEQAAASSPSPPEHHTAAGAARAPALLLTPLVHGPSSVHVEKRDGLDVLAQSDESGAAPGDSAAGRSPRAKDAPAEAAAASAAAAGAADDSSSDDDSESSLTSVGSAISINVMRPSYKSASPSQVPKDRLGADYLSSAFTHLSNLDLPKARRCLDNALTNYGMCAPAPEVSAQIRKIVQYMITLRILDLIRSFDQSDPPDHRRSAYLTVVLLSLDVERAHRNMFLKMAVRRNLRVGNYGISESALQELLVNDTMPMEALADCSDKVALCHRKALKNHDVSTYSCWNCDLIHFPSNLFCPGCAAQVVFCGGTLKPITEARVRTCSYCSCLFSEDFVASRMARGATEAVCVYCRRGRLERHHLVVAHEPAASASSQRSGGNY